MADRPDVRVPSIDELPPPPADGSPRKARAMVPARHAVDPGRSPRPEVVAELDRAFASMRPPARRTTEPARFDAEDLAELTGSTPAAFAEWPEWWMAEGEEIKA